jgi:hypothetical protein
MEQQENEESFMMRCFTISLHVKLILLVSGHVTRTGKATKTTQNSASKTAMEDTSSKMKA